MKKRIIFGILLAALCLFQALSASAELTRGSVIALEGMEETIEETLFESPRGFVFWYASERLEAYESEGGALVRNPYSDDHMTLTPVTEEEALKYLAEPAGDRTETEIRRETKDGRILFGILIAENGRYLRADGEYALEAAEGNAKFFRRVLDSVALVGPEDYLGRYESPDYDEVIIEKNEDSCVMSVTLYRLTSLEGGEVFFTGEGAVYSTLDASGNPITLTLFKGGEDRYALRVEESTWLYLEPGTVIGGLVRSEEETR